MNKIQKRKRNQRKQAKKINKKSQLKKLAKALLQIKK